MSTETPGRMARLRTFVKEEAWLLAGCLIVLMMVRSGARDAETREMREHRRAIEKLSQTERDQLRHNHEQFRQLSREEVGQIREVHRSVSDDETLDATLVAYHSWLASIPLERREEILRESDTRKRIALIEDLQRHGRPPGPTTGPNPPDGIASQFRRMQPLSVRDFESVMAKWLGMPERPSDSTPESILRYHVTIIDRVAERMKKERPSDRPGPDGRPPIVFPEELRKLVFDAVSERDMKIAIMRSSSRSPMAIPVLIVHSIVSIDVKRVIAHRATGTDDPLGEIRKQAPPRMREMLDAMRPEQREFRLRMFWLERYDRELSVRLNRYTERMQRARNGQRPIRDRIDGDDRPFPPRPD